MRTLDLLDLNAATTWPALKPGEFDVRITALPGARRLPHAEERRTERRTERRDHPAPPHPSRPGRSQVDGAAGRERLEVRFRRT
ncbi:hypothetical protein OIE66_22780 [Nonomuraea sp. NBC_01738]|uniref:hypothetical protein n=1 Tax=Nonomuraea sp. NBC_01738 TaxID=2976003 RepID=UPI002E1259D4|nr:hypothetical protein OIE66_22780 [Nonomuraea sp. NBC_01738]